MYLSNQVVDFLVQTTLNIRVLSKDARKESQDCAGSFVSSEQKGHALRNNLAFRHLLGHSVVVVVCFLCVAGVAWEQHQLNKIHHLGVWLLKQRKRNT